MAIEDRIQEAGVYVRRIRNQRKQAYARAYLFSLLNRRAAPPEPPGLSLMGAQAVRISIDRILSGRARTRSVSRSSRWAEVHRAEEAGHPIKHPRAFVFGTEPPRRRRKR
jgi:hypothetical protein